MAYPTLRSYTFRSAPLFGSGDQGPLLSNCLYVARRLSIGPAQPKNPSIRCVAYAALRRRNASPIASTTAGIPAALFRITFTPICRSATAA